MAKTKIFAETDRYSHADYVHEKAKHRANHRRKLTEHIKQRRMKSTNQYSYGAGYGVVKTEPVRQRIAQHIPAHTEPVHHLESIIRRYWDETEQKLKTYEDFRWVLDGYKTVPARTRIISKYIGERAIKPRLKRWHINKKWYRNQAAKKVRRAPLDANINNSNYKKFYDIKWSIW